MQYNIELDKIQLKWTKKLALAYITDICKKCLRVTIKCYN
jgi:hypothetical protein